MRRLACALLLAPALAPAQTPPPAGDGIPAGYFTRVARAWTFADCARGPVTWNGSFWDTGDNAVCADGRISLGQFANGRFGLWLDVVPTLNPALIASAPRFFRFGTGGTEGGYLKYTFQAPSCGAGCAGADYWHALLQPTGLPWASATGSEQLLQRQSPIFYPGAGPVDPATFAFTGALIEFAYFAPEGRAGTDGGYTWTDIVIHPTDVTTAPEPVTWALTLGGLAVLGLAARRRRGSV